jgi:hypothetical protein
MFRDLRQEGAIQARPICSPQARRKTAEVMEPWRTAATKSHRGPDIYLLQSRLVSIRIATISLNPSPLGIMRVCADRDRSWLGFNVRPYGTAQLPAGSCLLPLRETEATGLIGTTPSANPTGPTWSP